MEPLAATAALQIHDDELVPAGERSAVYDRAIDQAQRYVMDTLFKPTLGTQPPAAPEAEEGGLATIGRAIKDVAGVFAIQHTLR
jgi:hypothetical protein